MYPGPLLGRNVNREEDVITGSIDLVRGLDSDGMMNTREGPINPVKEKEPKMLIGSSQQAPWEGSFVALSDDATLSAHRETGSI